MRARRHPWVPTAIAATFIVTMGCRGSKPLGDLVQVSDGPAATEVPSVEPPPQRLATARPRATAANNNQPARSGAASGHRSPSETTSSVASAPANPAGGSSGDSSSSTKPADAKPAGSAGKDDASAADRLAAGSPSADAVMKDIQAALEAGGDGAAEKTATAASSQPRGGNATDEAAPAEKTDQTLAERAAEQLAALPENQRNELLKALGDTPPEVQQQAIRQLVAILARQADPTDSPSGIDHALQRSLEDLPELTETSASGGGPKPTRLASAPAEKTPASDGSDDGSSPQRITLSDQADDAPAPTESAPTQSVELADAPPRDGSVAQAVATKAVAGADAGDAVQPAAATEPEGGSNAGRVAQAAAKSEPAKTAPAQAAASELSDQQLYEVLLARLDKPVEGESEADRSRRKIMARHLMVLAGDPDRAVQGIEGLGEKEQEYLRHQLLGLWTIIDPQGHPVPGRRFTTALPQFREATQYLAAATDTLDVRALTFCTEIESYGQITEFPSRRFRPGQQVILYCEVNNFTAKQLERGYETHLQGSYNVYDAQDRKVASQLLPADRQVSRNYLRDYFIAYQMHLPQQLDPGAYRLELTMEDINGKKYGQGTVDFEIGK